jgi:hypothetical protein
VSSTFSDRPISADSGRSGAEAGGIRGISLGYPFLISVSKDWVLASTWSGRCLLIEVESGRAKLQPFVGDRSVGRNLRRPAVRLLDPPMCAVATGAPWGAVWTLGDDEARRIFSDHGSVNAVALSPDGCVLALGTGHYPLGPEYPKCALEIWSITGTPRRLKLARLPDVAVDQIWWDEYSDLLLVCSGELSQDRGHLWIFDGGSLELLESAPVDYCVVAGAIVEGGDCVLSVGPDRVDRRLTDELHAVDERWTLTESITTAALSYETSEIFFPTGQLINYTSGEVELLPPLPGCVGVAARPGGGFVGLAQSGMLRVWDRTSN